MFSWLRRLWYRINYDCPVPPHSHFATWVSKDKSEAPCARCRKFYKYESYYGYYPGFVMDVNMPEHDPRKFIPHAILERSPIIDYSTSEKIMDVERLKALVHKIEDIESKRTHLSKFLTSDEMWVRIDTSGMHFLKISGTSLMPHVEEYIKAEISKCDEQLRAMKDMIAEGKLP